MILSGAISYVLKKYASRLLLKIFQPFLVVGILFRVLFHLFICIITLTPIEKITFLKKRASEHNRNVRYFGEVIVKNHKVSFLQAILISFAPACLSFWCFILLLNFLIHNHVDVVALFLIFFIMISLMFSATPSLNDLKIIPEAFQNDVYQSFYQILLIVLSGLTTLYLINLYNLQLSHSIFIYLIISGFYILFKYGIKITRCILSSINTEREKYFPSLKKRAKKLTHPKYKLPIKPRKNPITAKKPLFLYLERNVIGESFKKSDELLNINNNIRQDLSQNLFSKNLTEGKIKMVDKKEEIKKRIIHRFEEEIEKFYLGKTHQSVSQIHQEFKKYFSDKTIQGIGRTSFPEDYKKIWSKPKVSREVYLEIKERIANEIKNFYSGCSAIPLAQIYREFEFVVNSVDTITYIAKKEFPDEYVKIWARKPIPTELKIEIINKLKIEIDKYKSGLNPKSLSRIHSNFHEEVKSVKTIAKIAKERFPNYYDKIWCKVKITSEIKNKAITRIKEEIDIYKSGCEPMTIRDIWKESFQPYMSEGQLGEIGRDIYPEDYDMIWSAYRIPSKVREELIETINNEISKYDLGRTPDTLRQIQRKFGEWVKSKDHIISIAKNLNPEKYEEIWSIPRISNHIKIQVIEEVRKEIDKYKKGIKPRTIKEIWENNFIQFIHAKDTISRIANKTFPEEYKIIWGSEVPYETRLDIIKDILDYDNPNVKTIGQIARKYGVSNTTIGRISVNEVEDSNSNFSHEDRFPKDFFADLGTVLHNILKCLITIHFWSMGFKIYSEIIVNFSTGVSVDNFFLNIKSHNYLYSLLDHNRHLARELSLDINELRKLNAFMFDYTNNVSEDNIDKKVKKYQKSNKLLFIVGTRWPRKNKKRTIDTRYKNIRIIKHDLFAELMGMDGDILEMFEYVIELNYLFDLYALKESYIDIKEEIFNILGRYLFVNNDLKKDLKENGIKYLDYF